MCMCSSNIHLCMHITVQIVCNFMDVVAIVIFWLQQFVSILHKETHKNKERRKIERNR